MLAHNLLMFKYRNVSPYHLVVPMVGEVDPDGILESEEALESHHLELVEDAPVPAAPAAPAPVAAVVTAQTASDKEAN